MGKSIHHLASEAETCRAAADLAQRLNPGDVVAIQGELGAGKSVFARALMRALGVADEAMPSPTFTLIQTYEGRGCKIAHMDWYRLESRVEVELLGIRDYFLPPWICLIEWPERAESLIPSDAIRVRLKCVADNADARILELELFA